HLEDTMATRSWTYASICFALAAVGGPASAQTIESVWREDSNQRPEEVCPRWKLVDSAPAAHPVLGQGKLVLTTAAPEQDMFYMQTNQLQSPLPDPIVVEATVQFTSGTASANNRGPIAVGITTAPKTGALFF